MASTPARRLSNASEWSVEDTFEEIIVAIVDIYVLLKNFALILWVRSPRPVRMTGIFMVSSLIALSLWQPDQQYEIPEFSLDYTHGISASPFNASKVALLIENRPLPILAPLILHFMSVVPPDWRFRFMGSNNSVSHLNTSFAIRNQVAIGKLDLTYIPANMSTDGQEQISRFLTNLWLYETVLQPAEWLLVYQTDSILCANSQQSLNNWLDFDWVGAPWNPSGRFGGNGGLSLRRVSAIIEILKQQVRRHNSEPEDVWLSERLGHRPGAKLANGTASLTFSGEMYSGNAVKIDASKKKTGQKGKNGVASAVAATQTVTRRPPKAVFVKGIDDWREGFYEPMGYHTGGSGSTLHSGIWGTPRLRKHIWDYCPEVKMTLKMDAKKYVPGECQTTWKRDEERQELAEREYPGMGEVDENGYPYLPELIPW